MNRSSHNDRVLLADEVLQYLLHHEQAQDTVEGIVAWWLPEQRIIGAISEVEGVLRELVNSGLVIAHEAPDKRRHYQMNPEKKEAIRCHLEAKSKASTLIDQAAIEGTNHK